MTVDDSLLLDRPALGPAQNLAACNGRFAHDCHLDLDVLAAVGRDLDLASLEALRVGAVLHVTTGRGADT